MKNAVWKKLIYGLCLLCAVAASFGIAACSSPLAKLSAPEGFELIGRTVTWQAVSGASGYAVAFEGREEETKEPCFALSYALDAGRHEIAVLSVGDDKTYDDSEWAVYAFTVEEPIAHGFDEEGWEYTLMEDGQGYEISRGNKSLDGALEIPAYFKGLPVKKIADEAFMYHEGTSMPNPHTLIGCNIVTTAIELPDTVTEIGAYSFACISKLEAFIIPDTVTKIGRWAFWGCTALKQVTLPKNLKVIPESCFESCALSEISFPDGLEEIGERAFFAEYYPVGVIWQSDQSFTKINVPDSVKKIGDGAFNGCLKLKEINLPDKLDWLGWNAFYDTAWLNSQPDGLVTIGNILYEYKGTMAEGTKITIPDGIKYLAGNSFLYQENLAEIVIPDGVKLIGEGIFALCYSLKAARLPADLTEIPLKTFNACESLVHIDIPSGVTEIGERAFYHCSSLEEIELPDGLKSIGASAFNGCSLLKEIVVPASLEELGTRPFEACDQLSKICYEGTEEAWKVLKEKNNNVTIYPDGRTHVITYEEAFSNATIYFFSETPPMTEGDFWRYVDGKPTVWEE